MKKEQEYIRYSKLGAGMSYLEEALKMGARLSQEELMESLKPYFWAEDHLNIMLEDLIYKGYTNISLTLIPYCHDLEKKNHDNKTLLMQALEKDLYEVANALIEAGADVNRQDNGGWNALFYAINTFKLTLVKKIISKGVNLAAKDGQGNEVLTRVMILKSMKNNLLINEDAVNAISEYLIESGATINPVRQSEEHLSPLTAAIIYGTHEQVKMLLDNGANLEQRFVNDVKKEPINLLALAENTEDPQKLALVQAAIIKHEKHQLSAGANIKSQPKNIPKL